MHFISFKVVWNSDIWLYPNYLTSLLLMDIHNVSHFYCNSSASEYPGPGRFCTMDTKQNPLLQIPSRKTKRPHMAEHQHFSS